jgi:hypothetical protein
LTEFADAHDTLAGSQAFYNQSSSFLDRLSFLDRYSYFGAMRSDVSNIGPNAVFLTQDGQLTDIGSWYLGGVATGNIPKGAGACLAVPRALSIIALLLAIRSLV